MNVLITCDKFRGSLEGPEVAEALANGILSVDPNTTITVQEIADGGEGSMELLSRAYGCVPVEITVLNAVQQPITAFVGFNEQSGVAVLEMAGYVGLAQLAEEDRNPLETSSYGLGQAILHIVELGAQKIIVGIGGSATNDGGAGMLEALGYNFYDAEGKLIRPKGGNLHQIDAIEFPGILTGAVELIIASDVNNPITGPKGATYTYGPQKGASKEDLKILEQNIQHYAELISKVTGNEVFDVPSYGAAGGIPLSACELLGAKVVSGSELIYDVLRIDTDLQRADLVITGEGKIDHQTTQGKAITPIVQRAKELSKKLILVCGIYEPGEDTALNDLERYELVNIARELGLDSFKDAASLCEEVGRRIAKKLHA